MDITTLLSNIGKKVDIIDGNLVLSDKGFLTVTTYPMYNAICINKITEKYQIIVPKNEYRGRNWNLDSSNCAHICSNWLQNNKGINLDFIFDRYSYKEKLQLFKDGYENIFAELNINKLVYTDVQSLIPGNILIYEYHNHIGIYIGEGLILHHKRSKLSSIDKIDETKILGVYNGCN